MKLFKYGLPFAALAVLASCSNDNTIDAPGVAEVPEDGYNAKFTVALPAVSGTRAIESDADFDNGREAEYKVKNAQIFIFEDKGDGIEDNYEYVTKSQIFYTPDNGTANDNTDLTQTVTINVRLNDVNKTDEYGDVVVNYYALCVVNLDDQGPNDTGDNLASTTPSNGFIVPKDGDTFGTWKTTVMGKATHDENPFLAKIGNDNQTYFTMTNAPTYTNWSTYDFTTLVPVDVTKFVVSPSIPTESAAEFFVQRGVVKVQLKASTTDGASHDLTTIPSEGEGREDDVFSIDGWNLDVTNNFTYPVQVVSNTNPAWDVYDDYNAVTYAGSGNWFYTDKNDANGIKFNHIWWAHDPNYGDYHSTLADDFYSLYKDQNSNTEITWNAIGTSNYETNILYCHENLMPYDHMIQNETTRVLVKGKYLVKGYAELGDNYSFVVNPNTDEAWPINNAKLNNSTPSGRVQLKALYLSETDENIQAVADALHMNPQGLDDVDFYRNGVTYYVARIHHFHPTDETPLVDDSGAPLDIKTVADYTERHTGRYSILRNNVYVVNVAKVLGYGSPTIPEPGNTPDDDPDTKKYNLKVDINVLKWAKRDYDYTLK